MVRLTRRFGPPLIGLALIGSLAVLLAGRTPETANNRVILQSPAAAVTPAAAIPVTPINPAAVATRSASGSEAAPANISPQSATTTTVALPGKANLNVPNGATAINSTAPVTTTTVGGAASQTATTVQVTPVYPPADMTVLPPSSTSTSGATTGPSTTAPAGHP